jgi:hypothetical protein
MALSPKQRFIEAFFDEFERKADRLQKLWSQSFTDEAFTLCLVYIDRLASGHYGGKYGRNRHNFWRALLEEGKLAEDVRASSLMDCEKIKLISNLWGSSIANIAYDYIRNVEVHGPGSGGLSFDESIYQGKTGVTLDFQVFYGALRATLLRVKEVSVKTSQWFGNPNYIKERK